MALTSVLLTLRGSVDRAFALLVLGAILASPLGWAYYAPWALLPLLVWRASLGRPRGRLAWTRDLFLFGALVMELAYLPSGIHTNTNPDLVLNLLTGSIVFFAHLLAWLALVLEGFSGASATRRAEVGGLSRPWLLASGGLAVAGLVAGVAVGPRQSPVADSADPTLVLVVLDSVRSGRTSLCGHDRSTTPYLERLVDAGAIYSCEGDLGGDHPLATRGPEVAETLSERGYQTHGIVGSPVGSSESWLPRGFDHFRAAEAYGELDQRDLVHALSDALRHQIRRDGAPLFLYVHVGDAHPPWDAVPRGQGWVSPRPALAQWAPPPWSEPYRIQIEDSYDFAVHRADAVLGWVMSELEAEGWLDGHFLIVVTGDHRHLREQYAELAGAPGADHVPVVVWSSESVRVHPSEPMSAEDVQRVFRGGPTL